MDRGPPCIAEEVVFALATLLVRKGVMDQGDIEVACAGLDLEAAHQLRCAVLEASAPSAAECARERFKVIGGREG